MKLLQRSSLYQLVLAVPMVLAGTAIGYWLVSGSVTEEVDEQLAFQAKPIAQQVKAGQLSFPTSTSNEWVRVLSATTSAPLLKDTLMPEAEENGEEMPWRIGRFPAQFADGSPCTIMIGRSLLEKEDLVMGIALSMTLLLALFVIANVLLNRWLSSKLWRPFHHTMEELERFRIDGTAHTPLPTTDVSEFTAMNRTLERMMSKMRVDLIAQKRFTERAAHELRTPLAVMQGKLDQLIQSPHIGEQEAATIDGLFQARERMGRTVTNMLLLARIGNQQFAAEAIDWPLIFQDQRMALEDLVAERGIRFSLHVEAACRIRLHPLLAEMLVANLLRNAVQHNVPSGTIDVVIRADGFTITNTGAALTVAPEVLFDRFAKGDPSSPSTGLGLSMVKEIADQNALYVAYDHAAGIHTLSVREQGAE